MNIALEQANEFVDGKLHRSYGDAFIRGNNGMRDCYSDVNREANSSKSCTLLQRKTREI